MSFLLAILSCMYACISQQDKSLLDRLCDDVADSCVELTYQSTIRMSGINTVGEGKLSAQGMYWKLDGNGVEMFCDASDVWVVDSAAKEVVIETAAAEDASGLMTNPASLFVRLKELFNVREERVSDDGRSILYILKPKGQGSVDYFNVELRTSDGTLKSGEFALKDGTFAKIEVSSMKLTPKRSVEDFRPKMVFDSKWIVTDMR